MTTIDKNGAHHASNGEYTNKPGANAGFDLVGEEPELAEFGEVFVPPKATYGAAEHALERHASNSPDEENTNYFPKGFFGPDDNDIELAYKYEQEVLENGTPEEDTIAPGYLVSWTIQSIAIIVPVRPKDGGGWEPKTMYPISGPGVTKFNDGNRS